MTHFSTALPCPLADLLKDLREFHKGWTILIYADGEDAYADDEYDRFVLTDELTSYETNPAWEGAMADEWESDDTVTDPVFMIFTNIDTTMASED